MTGENIVSGSAERVRLSVPVILASSETFRIATSISCQSLRLKPPKWLSEPLRLILLGRSSLEDYKGDERILLTALLYGGVILFDVSIRNDPIPLSRLHIEGSYRVEEGGDEAFVASDREILMFWRRLFNARRITVEIPLVYPSGYRIIPVDGSGACEIPPVGFEWILEE